MNEVHLWSDSEIALSWIRRSSSTWKQFIRNRVQQIQDLCEPTLWHHCPGKEHPADMASHGVKLKDLKANSFYWRGPSWLMSPESKWPTEKINELSEENAVELDKEKCYILATCIAEAEAPPVLRSSRLLKIKRVLAWMQRFVDILTGLYEMGELTANELCKAEKSNKGSSAKTFQS